MSTQQLAAKHLHWPLVAVVTFIALLGVYNLHSSAAAHDPDLYLTQMVWLTLGVGIVTASLVVDYRVTETFAYPIYLVVCGLLVGVLVAGRTVMGAKRWIGLGPFSLQPSELAKLAVIFCMARYFSSRILPGGYSFGRLIRPLNPSRPLAAITLLATSWNKPALEDPLGQIARAIRKKLGDNVPVLEDLMWFRALIIVLLVVGCALTVWSVVRYDRGRALLDPWPPGRRSRVILLCLLVFACLGAFLGYHWDAPVLRDPLGVGILELYLGAGPTGPYATVQSELAFRMILSGVLAVYFIASVVSLRSGVFNLDVVVAPVDLLAVPALLILVEPDLGTAGMVILIGMTMIIVVGVRLRSLLIMGFLGAMISGAAWFGILKDYQKRRVLTFIDPEQDIKGAGWNAIQSIIAVGSGQWTGKGHLNGTQTQLSFLPEQQTDFAFSVWAEEQGFVGSILTVFLYMLLAAFALAIAADAREPYGALLATGVAALIVWQVLINIGMVIGIFPVVGITLPLFSYGGSSAMTVLLGVGMLLSVHLRRRVQ